MANFRQREPLQELAEQGKQSLRAMPQIAHTTLGTFGLPHIVGAPWGGTLSTTKDVQRPMSNVACEGSHMKDFGGVGLVDRNHLIPSPF